MLKTFAKSRTRRLLETCLMDALAVATHAPISKLNEVTSYERLVSVLT